MSYIGKTPTPAPLTANDITDGIISESKLGANAVTSAKISDGTVAQVDLIDQAVNEAKMQVSNSPTNGYFLSAQSGNTGGMTWAEAGGNPYTALDKVEAGYITLVGGLIIQWGVFGTFGGTVSTGSVTFPIAFPNARFSVVTSLWNGNSATLSSLVLNSTIPKTGFTWYQPDTSQSGRVGSYMVTGH